jgi:hypothetical protein
VILFFSTIAEAPRAGLREYILSKNRSRQWDTDDLWLLVSLAKSYARSTSQ